MRLLLPTMMYCPAGGCMLAICPASPRYIMKLVSCWPTAYHSYTAVYFLPSSLTYPTQNNPRHDVPTSISLTGVLSKYTKKTLSQILTQARQPVVA
ncbi:hypothetical protein FPV67DRAFT_746719 [Lyophyllum atratum]|nr:hypothetical protein FPV67DRAFT_746719 [Lyophyllum atratum]